MSGLAFVDSGGVREKYGIGIFIDDLTSRKDGFPSKGLWSYGIHNLLYDPHIGSYTVDLQREASRVSPHSQVSAA